MPLVAAMAGEKVSYYAENFSYFDVGPKVAFTIEDYIRTNKLLGTQIYVLTGKQYQKDKPLRAYVVPIIDNQQYSVIICSAYPLTTVEIKNIDDFVGNSMFTNQKKAGDHVSGDSQ